MKDGWMQSGDAGYFNDGKQLVVIDRIKDLAETARGERFSPQYIENKLKFSPYIAETVVLGAGRDALAAMICIRFSIISKWAEKKRISFTTYTDLASRPEVYALLRKEVETVNATLPPAQRISRFLLLYKTRRRRRRAHAKYTPQRHRQSTQPSSTRSIAASATFE
jgi:long-chain acyl-CoA synthetase